MVTYEQACDIAASVFPGSPLSDAFEYSGGWVYNTQAQGWTEGQPRYEFGVSIIVHKADGVWKHYLGPADSAGCFGCRVVRAGKPMSLCPGVIPGMARWRAAAWPAQWRQTVLSGCSIRPGRGAFRGLWGRFRGCVG